jgi:GGDEF domain-containing protein
MTKRTALVRRGLDDLARVVSKKGRVLLVNDKTDEIRRLHPDDLDPETKFYNATFFSDYLAYATNRKIGEPNGFALLLLDIDGLRPALTAVGVENRSRLLREVTDKIWGICAYEHWGFRIAENEFALVMCGVGKEGALRGGNYVKSQIERAAWPNGVHLLVNVAVAAYPADGASESSLMYSGEVIFDLADLRSLTGLVDPGEDSYIDVVRSLRPFAT